MGSLPVPQHNKAPLQQSMRLSSDIVPSFKLISEIFLTTPARFLNNKEKIESINSIQVKGESAILVGNPVAVLPTSDRSGSHSYPGSVLLKLWKE